MNNTTTYTRTTGRRPSHRARVCFSLFFLALLASAGVRAQETAKEPLMKTGPEVTVTDPLQLTPEGPAPEWAPDIDPQMQAVIEQLMSYEAPPFTDLTAFQVRNSPLPAAAVADLVKKTGMPATAPKVDISHRLLPVGSDEGTLVRIYTPLDAGDAPLPVIVYYHGGGWVIADLDTYEASAIAMAEQTGAVVVSVAYRQAPEHPFPAAHEDSFAAYQWVVENTDSVGGDATRIATVGESAGGNLAVAVALMARERGVALPIHIVSVYPIADGDTDSESYDTYAGAVPLNRPLMAWFFDYYYPNWKTESEPLISLISADLEGLPETTIINAEIDPLETEGGELEAALQEAGVQVERKVYAGVTHEFFGMAAVLDQAVEAQAFAAERLKKAFDQQ